MEVEVVVMETEAAVMEMEVAECKGNPNSLDEQLCSQDLVRGNSK
jgi:hypothetical protein